MELFKKKRRETIKPINPHSAEHILSFGIIPTIVGMNSSPEVENISYDFFYLISFIQLNIWFGMLLFIYFIFFFIFWMLKQPIRSKFDKLFKDYSEIVQKWCALIINFIAINLILFSVLDRFTYICVASGLICVTYLLFLPLWKETGEAVELWEKRTGPDLLPPIATTIFFFICLFFVAIFTFLFDDWKIGLIILWELVLASFATVCYTWHNYFLSDIEKIKREINIELNKLSVDIKIVIFILCNFFLLSFILMVVYVLTEWNFVLYIWKNNPEEFQKLIDFVITWVVDQLLISFLLVSFVSGYNFWKNDMNLDAKFVMKWIIYQIVVIVVSYEIYEEYGILISLCMLGLFYIPIFSYLWGNFEIWTEKWKHDPTVLSNASFVFLFILYVIGLSRILNVFLLITLLGSVFLIWEDEWRSLYNSLISKVSAETILTAMAIIHTILSLKLIHYVVTNICFIWDLFWDLTFGALWLILSVAIDNIILLVVSLMIPALWDRFNPLAPKMYVKLEQSFNIIRSKFSDETKILFILFYFIFQGFFWFGLVPPGVHLTVYALLDISIILIGLLLIMWSSIFNIILLKISFDFRPAGKLYILWEKYIMKFIPTISKELKKIIFIIFVFVYIVSWPLCLLLCPHFLWVLNVVNFNLFCMSLLWFEKNIYNWFKLIENKKVLLLKIFGLISTILLIFVIFGWYVGFLWVAHFLILFLIRLTTKCLIGLKLKNETVNTTVNTTVDNKYVFGFVNGHLCFVYSLNLAITGAVDAALFVYTIVLIFMILSLGAWNFFLNIPKILKWSNDIKNYYIHKFMVKLSLKNITPEEFLLLVKLCVIQFIFSSTVLYVVCGYIADIWDVVYFILCYLFTLVLISMFVNWWFLKVLIKRDISIMRKNFIWKPNNITNIFKIVVLIIFHLCLFYGLVCAIVEMLVPALPYILSFFYILWIKIYDILIPLMVIVSSLVVIISVNPIYSLLALIFVFLSTTVFLLSIQVQFLSFIYLIIYIGAIAILFLFVIMLFNLRSLKNTDLKIDNFSFLHISFKIYLYYAIKFLFCVGIEVWNFIDYSAYYNQCVVLKKFDLNYFLTYLYSDILLFGNLFYTYYIAIFCLAGFLLLISMIGSIVLALSTQEKI